MVGNLWMATVSDWNGSIRNDHFKLPENLICCNHHFVFLRLKKTFFDKIFLESQCFANRDTRKPRTAWSEMVQNLLFFMAP